MGSETEGILTVNITIV